jgi:FAD/FMN-containing dehydrogenase
MAFAYYALASAMLAQGRHEEALSHAQAACGIAQASQVELLAAGDEVEKAQRRADEPRLVNFGVATSFEFRLHPVGPEVVAGLALYPFDRAREIMAFYRDFSAQAGDNLGTLLALRFAPPSPLIPEAMRGKRVVGIGVCYAGPHEEGRAAVQPVKALGGAVLDTIGPTSFATCQTSHDAGRPAGRRYYWKSEYLHGLSDDAIDTAIAYAASRTSPLTSIMFFQLGGAASRVPEEAMAASHRDASYVLNINTSWTDAGESGRHIRWARDLWTAMPPFAAGGVYVNFLSADEGRDRVRAAYGERKYARLVELKTKYDPDNLFRMNQNIRPAA